MRLSVIKRENMIARCSRVALDIVDRHVTDKKLRNVLYTDIAEALIKETERVHVPEPQKTFIAEISDALIDLREMSASLHNKEVVGHRLRLLRSKFEDMIERFGGLT